MTDINLCDKELETAVLFIVFNRLDTTKQVFEAIRKAQPPKIYIAADGARDNREGELEVTQNVRNYILENIDWNCEVHTLFRDKNLGCKYAVSSAITWFFEHEEYGIILEDDCLPDLTFFTFCQENLKKYKDDKRVWHIGGSNFQDGITRGEGSYYFSIFNHIWGWASWADRWNAYDVELDNIESNRFIDSVVEGNVARKMWKRTYEESKNKQIDTWDYQWTFTCWFNSGMSIVPQVNLIKNIGFGPGATHTHEAESKLARLPLKSIDCFRHSNNISICKEADRYTIKHVFSPPSFFTRVLNKVKRLIK